MNAQFSILVRQFTKLELADGDYVSADDVSVPAPLDTSDSGLLVAPPRERAACACDQHVISMYVSGASARSPLVSARNTTELGVFAIVRAAVLRPGPLAGSLPPSLSV